MTPAGWYRDPYDTPGLLRWWDGREWTQETRPEADDQPSNGSGGLGRAADDASPADTAADGGDGGAGAQSRADDASTGARGEDAGTGATPDGEPAGTDPRAHTAPYAAPDAAAAPRPAFEPAPDADAHAGGAGGAPPAAPAGIGTGAAPEAGTETRTWSPPGAGGAWPAPGQSPWPPGPGAAPAAAGPPGQEPAGGPPPAPGAWPAPGQAPAPWPQDGQAPGTWPQPGQATGAWPQGAPGGWQPGQVPPPWQYPEPAWAAGAPGGRNRTRIALLVGGAVVLVILILVAVAVVASGVGGGTDKSGRSPVTATINDTKAGISYAGLGGAWHRETVSPNGGLARLGFDQGEDAIVMKNYDNGDPYVASAYSGVVPSQATGSPQVTATALLATLEPVSYPPHTRQELSSAAHTVDGHDGWLLKVRFNFPEAKARGWNFRSETAAMVVVDRGNGQPPAEFYVSIPDSHKKQGDLDLLLSSLKVS